MKIQIIGGKIYLRKKAKRCFVSESLLTTPSNVLPLHLKQTFSPIISIFTEGDGIESGLPFNMFSTLVQISLTSLTQLINILK